MTKCTKLIDTFNKVGDSYNVTLCNNGFVIDISGRDSKDDWVSRKFIVGTLDGLKDIVQDISFMPRE